MATRVLPRRIRRDISSLYALVRIADEIVDGPAALAGCDSAEIAQLLDDFEADFFAAWDRGFDTNPAIDACADMARRNHIPKEYFSAFFASMREDVNPRAEYSPSALAQYVYGSAEVIGLMCVHIFFQGAPLPAGTEESARALGRAFQIINFLRDYKADVALGRHYVDMARKEEITAGINKDLALARRGIVLLPRSCQPAVRVATALFQALSHKCAKGDPTRGRIRLSAVEKVLAIWRYYR